MNCLDKDPAVRPESIRAIAQTIDANAAAQSLFITPPTTRIDRSIGVQTAPSSRRQFSGEFYIVMTVLVALLILAAFTLILTLRR